MYRNPKHKKTEFLKTYVTENQKEAFEAAAERLGVEPSVLLRECALRLTAFISSQQGRPIAPRRATDLIDISHDGEPVIREHFRLRLVNSKDIKPVKIWSSSPHQMRR